MTIIYYSSVKITTHDYSFINRPKGNQLYDQSILIYLQKPTFNFLGIHNFKIKNFPTSPLSKAKSSSSGERCVDRD